MKRVALKPIRHRGAYTKAIQSHVFAYFDEVIFQPLFDLMEEFHVDADNYKENSPTDELRRALLSGKIHYQAGIFSGKFSSAISRNLRALGASFDERSGVYRLAEEKIPFLLKNTIDASEANARRLHESMSRLLETMEENVQKAPVGLKADNTIDKIVGDLQKQFVGSVSGLDEITVPAQLTPEIEKAIREKFTENIDLYIKKFATEKIPELRRLVQQNAFDGYRTDKLSKIIQAQYGVTERKAQFLADQETSLLTAKFRQARYEDIGCREYTWSTSHDELVRPDHRVLNGKKFSFDNPPVTNRATGARNNPGEDFRCRCVAIPIVVFPD